MGVGGGVGLGAHRYAKTIPPFVFSKMSTVVRLHKQISLQCLQCSMCSLWTYNNATGGSSLDDSSQSSWCF